MARKITLRAIIVYLFLSLGGCAPGSPGSNLLEGLRQGLGIQISTRGERPGDYIYHTVSASNETLPLIAKRYTGDANNWQSLARSNPQITQRRLVPGTTVKIPTYLVQVGNPAIYGGGGLDYGRAPTSHRRPAPAVGRNEPPQYPSVAEPVDQVARGARVQEETARAPIEEKPPVWAPAVEPAAPKEPEVAQIPGFDTMVTGAHNTAPADTDGGLDDTSGFDRANDQLRDVTADHDGERAPAEKPVLNGNQSGDDLL